MRDKHDKVDQSEQRERTRATSRNLRNTSRTLPSENETRRHQPRHNGEMPNEGDIEKKRVMPIARLGVPLPVERKLAAAGILTVGDLIEYSATDLAELPLNPKGVREIVETLSYLGLDLAAGEAVVEPVESSSPAASASSTARKPIRENDRARAFAQDHGSDSASRRRKGPRLNDPADRARLIELYNTVTMEVDDAAWLYGISRGVAYTASNEGRIPTKKFDDRNKILTKPVFDELFVVVPDWLKDSGPVDDVA